jgi:predicted RNase H-related nuclease YkuK (DUF458 family)
MLTFKDSSGKDVTFEEIKELIQKDYEYEVFVGSDSQRNSKKKNVVYVTCIVLYKKAKGGKIFLAKETERYAISLKERLMNEVWRSLQTSFELQKVLPPNVEIVVHVDVNTKKIHKSADYCQELVSMVVGQGFKCRVKPDAFAAQSVADRFCK